MLPDDAGALAPLAASLDVSVSGSTARGGRSEADFLAGVIAGVTDRAQVVERWLLDASSPDQDMVRVPDPIHSGSIRLRLGRTDSAVLVLVLVPPNFAR